MKHTNPLPTLRPYVLLVGEHNQHNQPEQMQTFTHLKHFKANKSLPIPEFNTAF